MSEEMKLKPCPFCGSEARFAQEQGYGPNAWMVCCKICCGSTAVDYGSQEEAQEAWNLRPEPRQGIEEDEFGLFVYQLLRGCGKELAKEEWTAKHFQSECKNKATWLVKEITSCFTLPAEVDWPEKKDDGFIGYNGDGIPEFSEEGKENRGFNEAITLCKQAVEEARKDNGKIHT